MSQTPQFANEAAWQQANLDYLNGHTHRLRLLLARRILWLRARWHEEGRPASSQGAPELLPSAAITDAAADVLLRSEGISAMQEFFSSDPEASAISSNLEQLEALLQETSTNMVTAGRASALDVLCSEFGLNSFERDVLLLCVAAELDQAFPRLFAYAQDDINLRYATVPLALELFCPSEKIAHIARRHFLPAAPLRRYCLVTMAGGESLVQCNWPIRVDDRIVDYVCGTNRIDERVNGLLEAVRSLEPTVEQQRAVDELLGVLRNTEQRKQYAGINLFGPPGSGRRVVARQLSAQLGLNLFSLVPSRMSGSPQERQALMRLVGREAMLSHFAVYLPIDDLEGAEAAVCAEIVDRLPVFFIVASRTRIASRRELLGRRQAALDVQARAELWKSALSAIGGNMNGHAEAVAEHFQFGQEMMVKTVSAAAARARMRGAGQEIAVTEEDVWEACREQSSWELRQLAQAIDPSFTWDDIVLPAEVLAQLHDISSQVAYRAKVYRHWGFGAKVSRGLGISALFSGVSGTGKTMAAEVLARHLRLDLYRVDLAGVVSKYIGETEKNLKKIFDAAERSGAILFFDEADALFGKRTEVKDSRDRFANIEVNYLLQRMESFNGLSILATNRKADIDRAFLRRLRFLVDFPFPDTMQRMRIWHKSFPAGAPLAELDYDALARLEIPGGNIRNIALSAAFLAAERNTPISMDLLMQAARREYTKMEKMMGDMEFERPGTRPAWR
jgi:SpoVK/Ycf46/Vps4 family AAA+-type ATPase